MSVRPRNGLAAFDGTHRGHGRRGILGDGERVGPGQERQHGVRGAASSTSAGGVPRSNIAALDAASGTVLPWAPEADSWVASLAVRGNTVFAGEGSSTLGSARQNSAALDAGNRRCHRVAI